MSSATTSAAPPSHNRRSGSIGSLAVRGLGSELALCGLGDELFSSLCSEESNRLPSPTHSTSEGSSPINVDEGSVLFHEANKSKSGATRVTTGSAKVSTSPASVESSTKGGKRGSLRKNSASNETLVTISSSSSSDMKPHDKVYHEAKESVVFEAPQFMFSDENQGTRPLPGNNRAPNAEFASVYPKIRLNGNSTSAIMSRVQTNIPAFFDSASGARTVHVCSEPSATTLKVRGPSYIRTGIKVHSSPSLFALLGVDAFLTDSPVRHICDSQQNRLNFRSRLENQCQQQGIASPFLLCINIVVPWGNMVSYYYRPDTNGAAFSSDMQSASPADRMWQTFMQIMNTKQRNQVFKLIPRVIEGPWMVKKMIGNKPAIVGDKLPVYYHGSVEKGYLEIVMDCTQGNNMVNSIVNACKGAADALAVDLAFVVEGRSETELPEQILAAFRLHHISMKRSVSLKTWQGLMEQTQRQSLLL